jgi:hypothetical protein
MQTHEDVTQISQIFDNYVFSHTGGTKIWIWGPLGNNWGDCGLPTSSAEAFVAAAETAKASPYLPFYFDWGCTIIQYKTPYCPPFWKKGVARSRSVLDVSPLAQSPQLYLPCLLSQNCGGSDSVCCLMGLLARNSL